MVSGFPQITGNPLDISSYKIREPHGFIYSMGEYVPLYKTIGIDVESWIEECLKLGFTPHEDGSVSFTMKMEVDL